MLNLSSTIPSQIRFLLQSLNEANGDSVLRELCQFAEYGIEGSILMLQTCLDQLNLHGTDSKNPQLESLVASVFKYLMDKPNFSTVFSQSLGFTDINEQLLENLSNVLNLSLPERIGIGLALSHSENLDVTMCGKNFCMAHIEKLCANPVPMSSAEQIQYIVMFLRRSNDLCKHVDSLMQILSLVQSKDLSEGILSPFLRDELHEAICPRDTDLFHECGDNDFDDILAEMEKEISMGDVMKELGYGCTVDTSQCKDTLSLFLPLTEITLSKILGTIARTHAGLEDSQNTFSTFSLALGFSTLSDLVPLSSWNVDVLVKTIKQLAPNTNWIKVVENLDYEGFYFPSEEAFSFFMSVYKYSCQEPFPLHAICGSVWKNTEGQLSFLSYAVAAPPEVFTFAHSARQLAFADSLHGQKLQLGHANHAWLCLDLLDVLCQLAERGHASSVQSMLEYPLKHCPEVLLLGMAHINTAYNLVQHKVSFSVFPMIIKSNMGNGMILHIWLVNRNLVLRGFVDALNTESDSLIRILDICQELKILSSVLEMIPFPSAIRLAVLASQKELVDLDKWLSSNLNTYRDFFFEECLKFLKEIQFGRPQDFSAKPFHHSGALLNLYKEKISSILQVLKDNTDLITSTKLSEEIEKLQAAVMDSSPKLQYGEAVNSSTSEPRSDDVEAEANSYFHQMFSGQLTIEAMVQMLKRFKESSVKREHKIFECMIGNLFEEYRFFPKYPERQLRIAAVLFGSIIKHQLVTHLTLGIALRGVLDALRKPADSKMFVFGTKALEQFVDRLIEWPQYCNHILQISHLRSTHADLVAFIERALARISSGHLESDGASNPSVHQDGSSQGTSGNGEVNSSSITQSGQQLSLQIQLQQRNESAIDDHHKVSVAPSNDMKSLLSSVGQPSSVAPIGDTSSAQKLQNAVSAPAMLSASSGFARPSRAVTSTSNFLYVGATPANQPTNHSFRNHHLKGLKMGSSSKRARKERETEIFSEDFSDFENDEMGAESEEDEEEYDDVEEEEEEEEEGDDKQNYNNKDDEMEELEKEYMYLSHQEQDMLKNLKRHKDEDTLKGQAVKNQKALWYKTLEFRFLLQKAFSSSNRLPREPARSSFCASDEGVSAAYSDLIASSKKTLDSLLELQEALLEKNPTIAETLDGNSGQSSKKRLEDYNNSDVEGDEEWLQLSQMHKRIASFRDKSIDKWQRKTQVTTGAAAIKGKLHAFNQNISEQVASYLRDPSRIIKQMQQRRSTIGVFEAVPLVPEGVDNTKGEEAHPDGDPELLDDSEFYQQLLKEFFETVDPTSSETAFYAIKKLQTKKRKIVDRRASKSRKIRYNVREKIVNFMAPQPMDLPPMAPKLFKNLFGLKSRNPVLQAF